VHDLAEAVGPEYRLVVLFLAYTGLRWGEMAALRIHRIDFLRRRVLVAESVTPVKGAMTFGPTKGHERREVPLPRFLIDDLARHVTGRSAGDLVFRGRAWCGDAVTDVSAGRADRGSRDAGHPWFSSA
jgi:integrase